MENKTLRAIIEQFLSEGSELKLSKAVYWNVARVRLGIVAPLLDGPLQKDVYNFIKFIDAKDDMILEDVRNALIKGGHYEKVQFLTDNDIKNSALLTQYIKSKLP